MTSVLNAAAVYFFLLLVFRIAGRRTLGEITTFDFVLLLIISEAAQNALVGKDYSFTNAALLILSLVGIDIVLSHIKHRSKPVEKWIDGVPTVIVRHGQPLKDILDRSRVDIDDILSSARQTRGISTMDSIAYAVLETNGHITIIPAGPEPGGNGQITPS